jgi:lipopolysaccharide export LptBFGC system permease protein LptF
VHTLWRYVGTRFLLSLLTSFVVLTLVLLVVDMLLNLDEVLEAEKTLFGAVRFLFTRTAALYLPYLIPAATFTGAFVCLGQAARAREVVAIKAGGISPLRAVLPVFALALVAAVLALLLSETVTVRASAALGQLRGATRGDVSLRSGTIWYHTGRFIYNIRDPHPRSDEVGDIRVFERNDAGRLVRLVQARGARRLEPRRWVFRDATVREFDPVDPSAPPRVERAAQLELELAEDRSPRLSAVELAGLPLWTLAGYVHAVRSDRGDPGPAGELLHQRLTVPLLVILFALIAVPLGLRVEQTRSLSLPALEGVIVLFLFVSLREYAPSLAPGAGLPASAVLWGVVGLFAGYGTWQLLRVPQ